MTCKPILLLILNNPSLTSRWRHIPSFSLTCLTPNAFDVLQPLHSSKTLALSQIGFSSCTAHQHQFVTVTLENMFSEPIVVGNASLHFSLTEISKRAVVEMDKLFSANILPHEPLPLTLAPQESFSFVIKVNACPLGSIEEVGTGRKHVPPCLLLYWRPHASPIFLVSQFSIPFPTPQAEQLLLTLSVPRMPLTVNRMFDLQIALTNLASYPRSLAIELPFPEIRSLWPDSMQPEDATSLHSEEKLLKTLIRAKSREISILCIEKHVHLGRAEPKGELTAIVKCIASQPGIFVLDGIKVLDKHNRDDIRTYLIDMPMELSVSIDEEPSHATNKAEDEEDSNSPIPGFSTLHFSSETPESLENSKTELVLG